MKLTPGEKLIALMLADIHKHLKVNGEIDPDFVISAIHGDSWGLSAKYNELDSEEPDQAVIDETDAIFLMWRVIDNSVKALSTADQDALKKEVHPHSVTYEGFDANNDPHFGVGFFMVEKLGWFEERKPYLNSHSRGSLMRYRRMLPIYEGMARDKDWKFKKDDLVKILKG